MAMPIFKSFEGAADQLQSLLNSCRKIFRYIDTSAPTLFRKLDFFRQISKL